MIVKAAAWKLPLFLQKAYIIQKKKPKEKGTWLV